VSDKQDVGVWGGGWAEGCRAIRLRGPRALLFLDGNPISLIV